ncbi:MAG: minichromosome maintenance protein MCM [Methanobacteriaceae archaeon]|nr:minichromosome maintenance protein MCM [Methanobacteriaceae archaeon]
MNSSEKINLTTTKFEEFFTTKYKDKVYDVLEKFPDEKSLIIEYPEWEMFDPDQADLLLDKPEEVINAAKTALKNIDPLMKDADINIRFAHVTNIIPLKVLLSKYIGSFVSADGIIRKTDEIRPRIETGVFECRGCMRLHEVEQTNDRHVMEPSLCSDCGGRSFRLLEGESKYIDTQTARMQEPLENLSGGTEPKQMLMVLEDDLVDKLNPGDKVRITGTLKTFREERSGKFKNYIYVNYIEPLEQEFEELSLSEEDEKEILELSKDPDIYNKIIKSTAPSIKGYREVKEAIALQLFGGSAKILEDETRLRGDIHILIVGDPGIGKSQILKYVSKLAPRSIYTSGKGTTGAGLTAAAVRDELGGWSLEAGALVLGDQGNVCVDELDKMRAEDRSALHEALEQQTVSIAKAGIMATLNSRCSVLAAANPKFGRFDPYTPINQQIDLPPALISRFDLIFPIKDVPDKFKDDMLADFVLKIHKTNNFDEPPIRTELITKYVAYARKNCNPILSQEALNSIKKYYVEMRSSGVSEDGSVKGVSITARQLEGLLRLAEASAKVRLSQVVEFNDAQRAIDLLNHCLSEIAVDKETGKIDIDIISSVGMSQTVRSKIGNLNQIIRELEEEVGKLIPLEDIVKKGTALGMDSEEIKEGVEKLKRSGDIYEPKRGFYSRL